jgi:hypothetical protein
MLYLARICWLRWRVPQDPVRHGPVEPCDLFQQDAVVKPTIRAYIMAMPIDSVPVNAAAP